MQFDVLSAHAPAPARSGRWMALWATVCAATGGLSLLGAPGTDDVVRIWLASPVGALALLLVARTQWPAMLAALGLALWSVLMLAHSVGGAALVALLPAQHSGALSLHGWLLCALTATLLVAEMALAAWLLGRLPGWALAGRSVSAHTWALLRGAVLPAVWTAPWAGMLGVWAVSASPAVPVGWFDDWGVLSLHWMLAHTIGAVAMLPLALVVASRGLRASLRALADPLTLGLLLVCVLVSGAVLHSLPQPWVLMVAPLVWIAVRASLVASLAANALTALSIAVFMQVGLVTPLPSTTLEGLLWYLSVFATLLPGLYLAWVSEAQRQARAALARNEARAQDLYVHTPAMLHTIDAQGHVCKVSRLWLSTLGYRAEEVIGVHIAEFMPPDSARRMREEFVPHSLRDGRCDNVEYQFRRRDGSLCDVQLSAVWEYDDLHQPWRSLAVLQDLTEKKQLVARSHFAEHDPLTGLPNRVLLNDRLKMMCAMHARHGGNFALGFLDLDRFKQINDLYGHDAGDVLLQTIAQRLSSSLRASDTVCRLGGDEFVMLFSHMDTKDELLYLTDKLMQRIAQPCKLGQAPDAPSVIISVSMGLAIFPAHGAEPQDLLNRADQAMYLAKRNGRNRREIYVDAALAGDSQVGSQIGL